MCAIFRTMNSKCKPPKCKYMAKEDKCVKPNAYLEALAWCKRKNIAVAECKSIYESDTKGAQEKACDRYYERFVGKSSSPIYQSPGHSPKPIPIPPSASPRHSASSSPSSRHVFLDDILHDNVRKKAAKRTIKKFFENRVLRRYATVENRIAYYKSVQKFLQKLTEATYCLEPAEYQGKPVYKIGDFLYLIKQIGSKSLYGVIYKTVAKRILLSLVTKLMLSTVNENINEVRLNVFFTQIIHNKLSKHFLMCYKSFECISPSSNVPEVIQNKKYFLVLNELAHGDLYSLLTNNTLLGNTKIIFNIFTQCILALGTFHSYGFIHCDCHAGNFLFHHNKDYEKGYYHYIIYGKDYYLQSCEYNMMIYDFGLTVKHHGVLSDEDTSDSRKSNNYAMDDYMRLIPFFMLKTHLSLIDKKPIGVIETTVANTAALKPLSLFAQNLHKAIWREYYTNIEKKKEIFVFKYLAEQLRTSTTQKENIFVDVLPADAKILNNIPFIINYSNIDILKKQRPRILKLKYTK